MLTVIFVIKKHIIRTLYNQYNIPSIGDSVSVIDDNHLYKVIDRHFNYLEHKVYLDIEIND